MTKKVFIATPAYDGKVHVPYAISLTETCQLLTQNGYDVQLALNTCGSLLCAERNRILEMFWLSEADYLFCIDSDLGWNPNRVLDLFKKDEEFVAGVYPSRLDRIFVFRPCLNPNGSIVIGKNNLLEMETVPAGFMILKRSAIQKMRESYPERWFQPKIEQKNLSKGYCLFNTELIDGEFWGEDYVFCILARRCGIRIWVDPLIEFDHAGIRGALIEALSDKNPNDPQNQAPSQSTLGSLSVAS